MAQINRSASNNSEQKKLSISFYSKEKTMCPVCKKEFQKEEMLSGGGRMIAGNLTDELRRNFEPSAKYGKVYPLIYSVGACPNCHVAFFWQDFIPFEKQDPSLELLEDEENRKKLVWNIFPHFNLKRDKTLIDGAASYYLALLCYEKMPKEYSPTIKKAIICLRLAWLCNDLNEECPNYNYDYIAKRFYQKALFFYQEALEFETTKVETITGITSFGPDIDKNYGYDGVIYLSGLLEYKYGQTDNQAERIQKLTEFKHSIARIFGLGKSSKAKPGPLLEHSRNLYDAVTALLKDASVIDEDDLD